MKKDSIAISEAYRRARRNVSIICGVGLAWSAAQFEIGSINVPIFGEVSIRAASIPTLIGAICIYTMVRATLEFMMQPVEVRRSILAKVDFSITLYLARVTVFALSLAWVTRSWMTVLYTFLALLLAIISFLAISYILVVFLMPFRMWIRHRSGRRSVASSAFEAVAYSFFISWIGLAALIILIGCGIFNPFLHLGPAYASVSSVQLTAFSIAGFLFLISVYFDEKFLQMVFAYVPKVIHRTFFENGVEVHCIEPNPDHPDSDKSKSRSESRDS